MSKFLSDDRLALDKERARRSRAKFLLSGRPGREGFLFHDGHNQPIYQAAPGLLGLLEGRHVVERWKPRIVDWLDTRGHFFNHILHEFADEPYFTAIRRDIEALRDFDIPPSLKNRFLFHYLTVLTGQLEHSELSFPSLRPRLLIAPTEARSVTPNADLSLNGVWTAYHRESRGRYVERDMQLPINWELVPGIENYSGSMRFTGVVYVPADLQGCPIALSFGGVDYFADLWINGQYVGGHEGFFSPFEFDVSSCLAYGEENIVRLTVTSPNEASGVGIHVAAGWHDFGPATSFPNRKTLVKGTLGHHDAKRGGAWSAVTSQDGNTGGLWNDVFLRVRNPIHFRPSGAKIATVSLMPGAAADEFNAKAEMHFPIANTTLRSAEGRLRVIVEPANFSGRSYRFSKEIVIPPGSSEVSLEKEFKRVCAWQPWDQGVPHLYSVSAVIEVGKEVRDQTVFETGFRKLSVTSIGESSGDNGAFEINGRRVFVRGTNLLPTYWLSEYTTERIARDFEMLRAAGFNAVLLHNLVAPKRFYEAANRQGFMVVQMFPLQWSYEETPEFTSSAKRQTVEMAEFLYNEPSVVSYEVHNEPDMRTGPDLDNRLFDFALHEILRRADPYRWATTFSGGNHAYPGQFYPLRDDNSFQTLPGRFEHAHHEGLRISRHANMPTEFGIQAMPHVALFEEILSEARVKKVLSRIRRDPKWVAAGGEPYEDAERTIAAVKELLGEGSWRIALEKFDWRHLWNLGSLADGISEEAATSGDEHGAGSADERWVSLKLALLLLEVLHYSAFKGENFEFGLWKPARTREDFVTSSQARQYRLHKDAVETYLNAGVTGAIVGYFSFMFRDADWQAPTWGVVDAAWVPKKAYRAYLESNQPVRVTLPQALRTPIKLPGDTWFGAPQRDSPDGARPWVDAEFIVANDTPQRFVNARVELWLEDATAAAMPFTDDSGRELATYELSVDVEPGAGFSNLDRVVQGDEEHAPRRWIVPAGTPAGRYFLKARLSTDRGQTLSTNSYEFLVPDMEFRELANLTPAEIELLLNGASGAAGFHYWASGAVVYEAKPGIRGFLDGFQTAQESGIDLYEAIQGEHFFRHILAELGVYEPDSFLISTIWDFRSEILSPSEKTRVLFAYLHAFAERAASPTHPGVAQQTSSIASATQSAPAPGLGLPPQLDSRSNASGDTLVPVGRDLVPDTERLRHG
ncbi:MAG: hypothetical protein M3198_15195 [Actinomycetota bacterium]|nr:hypothetical protein [Actinomycetota bacterium]